MSKHLLKKFFQNECTPEEVKQLTWWMESNAARPDCEEDFKRVWNELKVNSGDSGKWAKMLDNVHERIRMEELYESLDLTSSAGDGQGKRRLRSAIQRSEVQSFRNRRIRSFYMGAALLAILCFAGLYLRNAVKQQEEPVAQIVEKSTGFGQKMTIHLKDGSKVILNSGSELTYPEFFPSDERVVYLTGEGFFDIAKDTERPFRVVTGAISTVALGTSFNIKMITDQKDVEIALVTGKVKINGLPSNDRSEPVYLQPGEMIRYSGTAHSFQKNAFNVDNVIAWKDGKIIFEHADYAEIKTKLEHWFGIQITENQVPQQAWDFTATFDNESLDNILKALRFGHHFRYSIEQKAVTLNFSENEKN